MPLTVPAIDDRKFQDLRDEALNRIPVHNPEWTNFNKSDPGVTLLEVFAFLTESLLYRANQIPERNRRKFLKLLGLPLLPATAAQGLVAFANERGPLEVSTLPAGLELRAGRLSFRLEQGLDVLPLEGHLFYKRELKSPSLRVRQYYDQLYASFLNRPLPTAARLYESVPLTGKDGVDLAADTVDRSFWVALALRKSDVSGLAEDEIDDVLALARERIGSKTLTLGIVPWLTDASAQLTPGGTADPTRVMRLTCRIPVVPPQGQLPAAAAERVPTYRELPISGDLPGRPTTLQVTLPDRAGLGLWTNLDPLEAGVGDFPPAIEDTRLQARVITWLRFSAPPGAEARILWTGINASTVSQRARVKNERLPDGTGAPDQVVRLARRPVLADSVRLYVTRAGSAEAEEWFRVDDLDSAGPEVPTADPRLSPGTRPPKPAESRVFMPDAEAGELRFGDGVRGARPPLGAILVADYDYSEGREGNLNEDAINTGPALPPGFSVRNPVATWGGADAESVEQGEKQVQRWLQHRDRLVTEEDFATIAWRTPGVAMGRVEVIPAATPELGSNEPGDAPGAVTLMLIPRRDPEQPDAPRPDRLFLDSVCAWLDPRRLVTTEVFLRGPVYKNVWLSVGIEVVGGRSIAEVKQAVDRELRVTLGPLPLEGSESGPEPLLPLFTGPPQSGARGWPLRKSVVALELAAVVARVPGISAVRELLLAGDSDTTSQPFLDLRGLELPRVAGLEVSIGPAVPLDDLRGRKGAGGPGAGPVEFVPVPVVPDEC